MPERPRLSAVRESRASTLSAREVSSPKRSLVAFPLDDFYVRAGLQLPVIETVEPAEIPQPYRSLLAHNHDMTPTLSAFHARVLHLRVLGRRQRGDFYFREVVLLTDETEVPVEFGAIRINLGLFGPPVRAHILDERIPLGDLLRIHSVPHSSCPKAFFRLDADLLMCESLQLSEPQTLYGRRNTLLDAVRRPLAEVVEILPPVREPSEGYLHTE